jgi:hypothetical protein
VIDCEEAADDGCLSKIQSERKKPVGGVRYYIAKKVLLGGIWWVSVGVILHMFADLVVELSH